jgi:hypothetical protein
MIHRQYLCLQYQKLRRGQVMRIALKAGSIIHAFSFASDLRNQSLVVIHSQHHQIFHVAPWQKKHRPDKVQNKNISLLCIFYSRFNDLFFFFANQPFITGMRVQGKYSDLWFAYQESF